MNFPKNKNKITYVELIYYISLFIYMFSTTLKISMLGQGKSTLLMITLLRVASVLGCIASFLFRTTINKKYLCLISMAILIFLIVKVNMGDHGGFLMFIVMMCAWKTKGDRIGKIYLLSTGLIVFVSWVCSRLGLVSDRVFVSYRVRGEILHRHAYGMTYTGIFSTLIFFILAVFLYLNRSKKRNIYTVAFLVIVSWLTYRGTQGRLEFFMEIILLLYYFGSSLWEKFIKTKIGKFFFLNSFLLSMIISYLLVFLYMSNHSRFYLLNWFMTGRLELCERAIKQYGFSLFGKEIEMLGGGTLDQEVTAENYFFVDSFYMNWGLVYGLVLMFVLCIFFYWLNKRIYSTHNSSLMFFLVITYLHGIIISSIMQPQINPFFCIAVAEASYKYLPFIETHTHLIKRKPIFKYS